MNTAEKKAEIQYAMEDIIGSRSDTDELWALNIAPIEDSEYEIMYNIYEKIVHKIEVVSKRELAMPIAIKTYLGMSGRLFSGMDPIRYFANDLDNRIDDIVKSIMDKASDECARMISQGVWTKNVEKIRKYEEEHEYGNKVSSTNS